jgi:hypothetical protein
MNIDRRTLTKLVSECHRGHITSAPITVVTIDGELHTATCDDDRSERCVVCGSTDLDRLSIEPMPMAWAA